MTNPHVLVIGESLTGKSWLMKRRLAALKRLRQLALIFDGQGDASWNALGFPVATEPDEFERLLRDWRYRSAFVFVDEAGALFEETRRAKRYTMINRLTTQGRHFGRSAWLSAQLPTQIDKRVRGNCGRGYVFGLGDHAEALAVAQTFRGGRELADRILAQRPLDYLELTRTDPPIPRTLRK